MSQGNRRRARRGGLHIRPCRPAQPPGPGYYATGVGRIYNPPLREGRERVRRGGLHGRPDRTGGLPQTCLLRTRPVVADAHIGPPGPNHNAPRPWRHAGMPPYAHRGDRTSLHAEACPGRGSDAPCAPRRRKRPSGPGGNRRLLPGGHKARPYDRAASGSVGAPAARAGGKGERGGSTWTTNRL